MNLEDLRHDIDRIDARIACLLSERLDKALLTKAFKKASLDETRENRILASCAARAHGLVSGAYLQELYRRVMQESRTVQERAPLTVGFQGVHGANGDTAARRWLPDCAPIPCHDFAGVFNGVQEGWLDYGIVPVENTLGGTVGQVSSILATTAVRVVGAVDLPIRHCLLVVPGQDHRDLRHAWSHPQALAQCRHFLQRNRLEGMEYFDTAGAARMLAEQAPPGGAAIAGREAAGLYGLEILKEDIQDASNNRTRFFVLGRSEVRHDSSSTSLEQAITKCSVVFFTENKAGALFGILEIFASAGINLTRIESAPHAPGNYAIFLDLVGSDSDPAVAAALERASAAARDFRLLGCYSEQVV